VYQIDQAVQSPENSSLAVILKLGLLVVVKPLRQVKIANKHIVNSIERFIIE